MNQMRRLLKLDKVIDKQVYFKENIGKLKIVADHEEEYFLKDCIDNCPLTLKEAFSSQ